MHDWIVPLLQSAWVRDSVGYVAGSLVLCTFSAKSIRLLRCLGIASNIAFICYAIMASMTPILVLHSLLLPINIYRLAQMSQSPHRAPPRPRIGPAPSCQ